MQNAVQYEKTVSGPVGIRQKTEYDRFGPWTYPVTKPDEMPPCFDGWYEELRDSVLIMKQPFPVERKAAIPGSNLYERILAVRNQGIVTLAFANHGVDRQDIGFSDITALRISQELLRGRMAIDQVNGESLSVVFNTVSADLFEAFVDAVRRGISAQNKTERFHPVTRDEVPFMDMLSATKLDHLRHRDPGFVLDGYQEPCVLKTAWRGGRRGLGGLAVRLMIWRLDGGFMAVKPSELAFFIRGNGAPRVRKQAGYRNEMIFLPAVSFKSSRIEKRIVDNGATLHVLVVSQTGRDYEMPFTRDGNHHVAFFVPFPDTTLVQ